MRQLDLPIFEIEQRLLETLTAQKRLVLTAPTGSGKSTQVPQMLLDGGLLGDGQVTILQPRRLPTRMLAAWVAQARGTKLGGEVGYQMRLDKVTSAGTRIRYVTEGVLLRQMLADPVRRHYARPRTANSAIDAARPHYHRHVRDFGCRRGAEISSALRDVVVGRPHLSRRG